MMYLWPDANLPAVVWELRDVHARAVDDVLDDRLDDCHDRNDSGHDGLGANRL
jgi:hypothetical protein